MFVAFVIQVYCTCCLEVVSFDMILFLCHHIYSVTKLSGILYCFFQPVILK